MQDWPWFCTAHTPCRYWQGCWVSNEEEQPLEGSRGTAHFVVRWEGSRKQSSLSVVPPKSGVREVLESDEWADFAAFECRGMEPIRWQPSEGYVCEGSESGAEFTDIDLSDADGWTEWDEDGNCSVSITELQHRFVVRK